MGSGRYRPHDQRKPVHEEGTFAVDFSHHDIMAEDKLRLPFGVARQGTSQPCVVMIANVLDPVEWSVAPGSCNQPSLPHPGCRMRNIGDAAALHVTAGKVPQPGADQAKTGLPLRINFEDGYGAQVRPELARVDATPAWECFSGPDCLPMSDDFVLRCYQPREIQLTRHRSPPR